MLGSCSGQLTHMLKVSIMASVCPGGQYLMENKELIPLFMVPIICPPVLPLWLRRLSISCNARDPSSGPGSGKAPGAGNGNPLQYSCLKNPTDRDVWWATVHGVAKSWIPLSN